MNIILWSYIYVIHDARYVDLCPPTQMAAKKNLRYIV